jgi:MFS family permease
MAATPVSPRLDPPNSGTPASQGQGVLGYLSSLFWVYSPSGKNRRIFPGWWEVLAGSSHSFFGYGFYLYSWSIIIAALTKQFGWTATMVGVTGSITKEDTALEGPVVGWLLDRYGPQKVAAGGWAMAGLGFMLLPLLNTSFINGNIFWMYLCYGFLVSMGANACLYNTSYKAVNRWFIQNRGMTIGMASWGSGFGSPVLIPVTAALVTMYGWVGASMFIGFIFFAMGVTSSLALFRRYGPEQTGFYPDNMKPAPVVVASTDGAAVPVEQPAKLRDFSVREALKMPAFWFWTMGATITGIGGTSVFPTFQNLALQEHGLTPEVAALWYSLDFLFTIIGRTGESVVGDIIHPRWGYGISLIVEAIGFYCFAVADNTWWLMGYAVLHGIGYGFSIPAAGVFTGAIFGRERYATIRGLSASIVAVISFGGPILFGFVHDMTHSYYWPFAFGAATMAVNGFMMFLCRTPKGQIEPGRRSGAAAAH